MGGYPPARGGGGLGFGDRFGLGMATAQGEEVGLKAPVWRYMIVPLGPKWKELVVVVF